MIRYGNNDYVLHRETHNGSTYAYLCDGSFTQSKPRRAHYVGYIFYGGQIVEVWSYNFRPLLIVLAILMIVGAFALSYTQTRDVYFQACFAEAPLLKDGTLYCNVVNKADFEVTVTFTDGENVSTANILQPGDTLPYTSINFIPTEIVYNQQYSFPLEVRYD